MSLRTYIVRKRLAYSLSMNLDNSAALRNNDLPLPMVCIYALMCQYTAMGVSCFHFQCTGSPEPIDRI